MKNTKKEEIRRRMSHGELLRGFNNGNGMNINGSNNGSFNGSNNGSFNGFNNGMNNGSFNGSDAQSTNGEEEKTVFFDAQVRNHQIIVVLKTTGKGNDCLNIAKKISSKNYHIKHLSGDVEVTVVLQHDFPISRA